MKKRILFFLFVLLCQQAVFSQKAVSCGALSQSADTLKTSCVLSQITSPFYLVEGVPSRKALKIKKGDVEKVDAFARTITVDYARCGFKVPPEMLSAHPGLVYLIIKSQTLASDSAKQKRFDLYPKMTEKHIKIFYELRINEQREKEYRDFWDNMPTKEFQFTHEDSLAIEKEKADTLLTHCVKSQVKHPFKFFTAKPLTRRDFTMQIAEIDTIDNYARSLNIDYAKCGYRVSPEMIEKSPGLVYLIIFSKAFPTDTRKQEILDLSPKSTIYQDVKAYEKLIIGRKKLEYIDYMHKTKK